MDYLLVAEVDKIQSFIFRSSKLREVVGASYLLTDFHADVEHNLGLQDDDILTNKGGSFRLLFRSQAEAVAAGERIRRVFNEAVSGSITIAQPVEYNPGCPKASIKAGNQALRHAKSSGRAPEPVHHMPFMALCESCGVEPATRHTNQIPTDDTEQYYCESCISKAEKAHETRKSPHKSPFFSDIIRAMEAAADWEGGRLGFVEDGAYDADTYASSDGYVAYLAADGNSMGRYFGNCANPDEAKNLSRAVNEVTTQALACATAPLMEATNRATMPVLPLILGGDDLLVLLPGRYAFDVARVYAAEYQVRMTEAIKQINPNILASRTLDDNDDPCAPAQAATDMDAYATVGVGVVVCKSSYPFRMAHTYAEHLLDIAKDYAKSVEVGQSALCMDVILRSDLMTEPEKMATFTVEDAIDALETRAWLAQLSGSARNRIRKGVTNEERLKDIMRRVRQVNPTVAEAFREHRQHHGSSDFRQIVTLYPFMTPLPFVLEADNAASV